MKPTPLPSPTLLSEGVGTPVGETPLVSTRHHHDAAVTDSRASRHKDWKLFMSVVVLLAIGCSLSSIISPPSDPFLPMTVTRMEPDRQFVRLDEGSADHGQTFGSNFGASAAFRIRWLSLSLKKSDVKGI